MARPRIRVAAIIAAIVLIGDTLVLLAVRGGLNLGTLLPAALGTVVLASVFFDSRLARLRSSSGFRRLRRALLGFVSLWAASFLLIESLILVHAFPGAPESPEWLIVLGAGLRGNKPSVTLQRRLEKTVQFAREHEDVRIVVSGGQGVLETVPEAEAMRRYLVENGVGEGQVYVENHATSTLENLRLSKQIIDDNGGPGNAPIAVLSNEFHLFRVSMLGSRLNMRVAGVSAPTPWYLLPNMLLREYFAVIKSFLFDR